MAEYTKNLKLFKYDPITDAKQVFSISDALNYNWDILDEKASGAGMPVGTIFSHTCSASFVPENSLPCDGTEYAQSQFQTFYNDWLVGGRLNTCTYEEYQTEIGTYGKCAKFGLDTVNGKFKVPTIPDGTHIQQALTDDELGKSYKAGLPNIKDSTSPIVGQNTDDEGALTKNGTGRFSFATSGGAAFQTLTIDASKSNPIYSDDVNTVQTEAIALRFFVVVATGTINESEMDWSAWASSIQNKANIDADNFTTTGKGKITSWAFPSNRYQNLTLGSNGATYTAPANGWFNISGVGSSSTQGFVFMFCAVTSIRMEAPCSSALGVNLSIPVKKGDVMTINYIGLKTGAVLRFTYAEGDI